MWQVSRRARRPLPLTASEVLLEQSPCPPLVLFGDDSQGVTENDEMADHSLAESSGGSPGPPHRNPALTSALLESLYAIDVECEGMYTATLHYSLTKHVHAIRKTVAEMMAEITGPTSPA